MRDIVYKALINLKNNKQDISIQETFRKNGVTSVVEKRCRYFIMARRPIDKSADIENVVQAEFADLPYQKKHYYLLKNRDDKHEQDSLFCKIAGVLYAVNQGYIYCIAFVHSFKVLFKMADCHDAGGVK
jgi:hypothetical protein